MKHLAPLILALFIAVQCTAQYKVQIVVKDTVCVNEPFMVSYMIEGRGEGVKIVPQMKFERAASEGLIQLNEKLLSSHERVVRDTAAAFRNMGYLFVPEHDGEIILPVGRFTGKDTVTVAPKKIFVLNKRIKPEDSTKIVQSRALLFKKTPSDQSTYQTLPDPSTLVMHTNVSNAGPAVGEEFAISWDINSPSITPVIPSKKDLEKDFIVVSGPVDKGKKNSEHPEGQTKLEYIVKARKPGKYRISGATAKVSGKPLKSEPVEIIVK